MKQNTEDGEAVSEDRESTKKIDNFGKETYTLFEQNMNAYKFREKNFMMNIYINRLKIQRSGNSLY